MTAVVLAKAVKGCFTHRAWSQLPRATTCVIVQHRDTSSATRGKLSALKKGTGGRSSFSGVVATVFGASGFIGRSVVNQLGKIGSQVIIPYRCDPYFIERLRLCGDLGQILFFPFHLRDEESIRKVLQYSNVVINLCGRNWDTRNFTIEDVHTDGARRLARIAKESGVERFIHLSHLNAKADPQVIFKPSRLLKAQHEGELAVREEFPEAIIFKCPDVYGEDDNFLNYYIRHRRWTTASRNVPLWKKGEQTIKQPVDVSDLAKGIVQAVRSPGFDGKTIDAVGAQRYYLADIVDYILRITRRHVDQRRTSNIVDISTMRMKAELFHRISPFAQVMYPEKLELEHITDWTTPGNPTLEDLGIEHKNFVDMAYYHLFVYRYHRQHMETLGEFPHPEPPLPADAYQSQPI